MHPSISPSRTNAFPDGYSPSGVMMRERDIFPSVSVPVLSQKRIPRFPLVSIPTIRRTSTFFFIMRFMFEERTTVIIIGSPSGTATTRTDIASVSAERHSPAVKRASERRASMTESDIPESMKNELKRYAPATRKAAIYPMKLIFFASSPSLFLSGLSVLSD